MCGAMLGRCISQTNGATSVEREMERAICGDTQIWAVVEETGPEKKLKAVGITSIQLNADGSKTASIEQFSGDDMHLWFDRKQEFEAWAKSEGCKDIRLWARKGWSKPLKEYRTTHFIMTKSLVSEKAAA